MATRLQKEARELLPVLVATLVLMVVPEMLWRGREYKELLTVLTIFVFGLGCAVMGGLVFGSEFQHRTVGLLLSQPVRRSVLWWEKMLVLGAALIVSFGVLLGCLTVGQPGRAVPTNLALGLALVPLCAFCGAPYMTLLARSGLGGMVFATVLPLFFGGVIIAGTEHWFPQLDSEWIVLVCLCLYSLVVAWRGYCRFQDLQFKDGGTAEVVLPARIEGTLARGLAWVVPGNTGPWVSLLKKEFRLQQMSILLAAVFSGLGVLAGIVHWVNAALGEGLLVGEYLIYLLVLPFMVGAMAVAEERTLGITEWHLTLPVAAWKQWAAKMVATLSTSVALGVLFPGLWFLGAGMLFHLSAEKVIFPDVEGLVLLPLFLALSTSVAAYAASLSESTIRAILLAFGLMTAGGGVISLTVTRMQDYAEAWGHEVNPSRRLLYGLACAGAVVMVCLLQWLACRNFRRCRVSVGGFAGQLVGILLGLAVLVGVLFWAPVLWPWK